MDGEVFDFVIVGAGSAGCVLANRLTASGKHRVLLLEAGGKDSSFWVDVPAGSGFLMANPAYIWRNLTSPTQFFAGRSLALIQGKTLGGSSSINGMMYIRGQKSDFDGWAKEGCDGWSWDDVLPLFKRSENLESGGSDEHHGREGELRLSWVDDLHPASEQYLEAAKAYGLPFNPDINSGNQEGIGYLLGSIYKGKRQSTARAFLDPVKDRPNLTILTNRKARRVIIKDGKAIGIEVQDANGNVELHKAARELILSAGALGSPFILQHSGIGDAERLKLLGVEPILDRPEVGQNLQDHLFGHVKYKMRKRSGSRNHILRSKPRMALQVFRWLFTGRGMLNTTTSQISGFVRSSESVDRPDIQISMRPFSFHPNEQGSIDVDHFPGMTVSAIQTQPFSRGSVHISSNKYGERGEIDAGYLKDQRDIDVLASGMRTIRGIMNNEIMQELVEGEIEPGTATNSDEDIDAYIRRTAGTVYHPVGTCRMGVDDGAVVDPRLRVRGVQNLRVVDASIMPQITSGNTNAPAIMIGEKGADMILEDAVQV